MTAHCVCFSDFLPNIEHQYLMGWSFAGLITLFLVANGQIILRDMLNKFRLLTIRSFRRLKQKCQKKTKSLFKVSDLTSDVPELETP